MSGIAHADFTQIENFETLTLGPISQQGQWVAGDDTSVVALDPETGVGQVLAVTTDSTHLHRPMVLLDDSVRMVFLRFRFAEHQIASFGLSDHDHPFQFGDYDVELSMSNASDELRINNGGTYDVLTLLAPDVWYNCWILVNNEDNTTQVWINNRPLDRAMASDQLDSNGQTIFDFRGTVANDLRTFFIKTGGGSGPGGPLYIDDIYLEDSNQLNLTNPLYNPGSGFCFGDPASGTPCPCSNDNDGSVPGSGCANGVFPSGARLTGGGIASLGSDSLMLYATHLEPSNSALFFQADNDLSPGLIWGDGLRCAGGSLKRLGTYFADSEGYADTSGASSPISVKAGNVLAGDTKHYQCWYRTIVSPPCGTGVNDFNSSNGYTVTWGP